jgi:hypothetical protein
MNPFDLAALVGFVRIVGTNPLAAARELHPLHELDVLVLSRGELLPDAPDTFGFGPKRSVKQLGHTYRPSGV